jgi:hypothetical protein
MIGRRTSLLDSERCERLLKRAVAARAARIPEMHHLLPMFYIDNNSQ